MPVNEMSVPVKSEVDIIKARQLGRAFVSTLGFSPAEQTLVATVISELARSILGYTGCGEVALRFIEDQGKQSIVGVARYRCWQTHPAG